MSKFTPIDEKEYKLRNVWPAGWYAATVVSAIERMSSNNNFMFETKFEIYNDDGKKIFVTSYILAESKAAFQLRSFAEGFGVLDKYRASTLSEEDMIGCSGFVKLSIEIDKNGQYPDKNCITDYRKSMPGTVKAGDIKPFKPMTKKEREEDLSDGIPF